MTWRVAVGSLLTVAVIILVTFWAVNEPARMEQFTTSYEAREVEAGAALFAANCATCHGDNGLGIPGRGPALNNPALFDGTRLSELGWTGTLSDFVELTVAAGRPVMAAGYGEPMPTWSQEYGGPLRPDEVRAVTAYVLNWERDALAAAEAGPTPEPIIPVGTDLDVELPEGDPVRGQEIVEQKFVCTACHSYEQGVAVVGPSWYNLAGNAAQRRADEGYDAVRYLHESIVMPNAYIVAKDDGTLYPQGVMPQLYAQQMTAQDLADVLSYLLTLTGE